MAEEDIQPEKSTFSYLWYTAIWYLIQFAVITGLHFYSTKKLDKKVVQKSALDTLLLALVFISLQWSQSLISYSIYRLPYVFMHLFVDLIPTALWLAGSELLFLQCLGLAQLLYNHITDTKENLSSIEKRLNMTYFVSIASSQQKVENSIQKYITVRFPKLAPKLERRVDGSPALAVLFKSASLLLQLSTLGLVFVDTMWAVLRKG